MRTILDEMRERRIFCDGGMGSLLQAAGLQAGELPERWNLSNPQAVSEGWGGYHDNQYLWRQPLKIWG